MNGASARLLSAALDAADNGSVAEACRLTLSAVNADRKNGVAFVLLDGLMKMAPKEMSGFVTDKGISAIAFSLSAQSKRSGDRTCSRIASVSSAECMSSGSRIWLRASWKFFADGDGLDAMRLWKWASEHSGLGSAMACFSMGDLLIRTESTSVVARNPALAVELLQKATLSCHASAAHLLGLALQSGDGVGKDPTKAAECFKRAAAGGNIRAMTDYGLCLRSGVGVDQNHSEAFAYFVEAAKLGCVNAWVLLGESYAYGLGVERNLVRAKEAYVRAADLHGSSSLPE